MITPWPLIYAFLNERTAKQKGCDGFWINDTFPFSDLS